MTKSKIALLSLLSIFIYSAGVLLDKQSNYFFHYTNIHITFQSFSMLVIFYVGAIGGVRASSNNTAKILLPAFAALTAIATYSTNALDLFISKSFLTPTFHIIMFTVFFISSGALFGALFKKTNLITLVTGTALLIAFFTYLFLSFTLAMVLLSLAAITIFIIHNKKTYLAQITISLALLFSISSSSFTPISTQNKFDDKILAQLSTNKHELVITEWRNNQWNYVDGKLQHSTLDMHMYYEPMVIPAYLMQSDTPQHILILGNENNRISKTLRETGYEGKILHAPFDHKLLNYFTQTEQKHSLDSTYSHSIDHLLSNAEKTFDLIYIDLQDPYNESYSKYYTLEFYAIIHKLLNDDGAFVTQSLSPFYTPTLPLIIDKTIQEVGFNNKALHNSIPTIGEWSWIYASKISRDSIEHQYKNIEIPSSTIWLNESALELISHFGKSQFIIDSIPVNRQSNHIIVKHYQEGRKNLSF
ncbi:spermine/spermidine synthase domain-containing protein [Aureibacter tunicatorum]|uniref:Membrane-bound spermidine synthase n=1 Tax=Aureibacter tunicatorum TaxID=866807 RepID=A0AAE4BRQ9_9BACT|nr:hypothetical protein [Aureibacter tunicatorum]MDR6238105.1 putative membrane-bound spermidine synthase [Aureibacter tunicatorum]BDD03138.1 hypothetical protein AUTU_06210 [Aureibacter tunicatorum]